MANIMNIRKVSQRIAVRPWREGPLNAPIR
jgi:hypothetical protein